VLVSTPVRHTGEFSSLNFIKEVSTTIIDTASTKKVFMKKSTIIHRDIGYVLVIPLQVLEFSGPTAAITNLYKGKKNITRSIFG
jgi:hypothetical protein